MNQRERIIEMEFIFDRKVVTPERGLKDLALEGQGAKVIFATDEFFGAKENLIRTEPPIQKESGLDAWVTKRRRGQGHDFSIIKLGKVSIIKEIIVDTSFMDGMTPSFISIDIQNSVDVSLSEEHWTELLPMKPLSSNRFFLFRLSNLHHASFVRLNVYPDGGIARLRLMGEDKAGGIVS
tara:strand:+ start:90 stop:629 length:540 start_codon:yes stop_codon:yes gene_type:complete